MSVFSNDHVLKVEHKSVWYAVVNTSAQLGSKGLQCGEMRMLRLCVAIILNFLSMSILEFAHHSDSPPFFQDNKQLRTLFTTSISTRRCLVCSRVRDAWNCLSRKRPATAATVACGVHYLYVLGFQLTDKQTARLVALPSNDYCCLAFRIQCRLPRLPFLIFVQCCLYHLAMYVGLTKNDFLTLR